MSDIERLTKMLQSRNSNDRYNACEELRVSPFLPLETLEVLRSVTNDSDPDVTDAAHRAINFHTPVTNQSANC